MINHCSLLRRLIYCMLVSGPVVLASGLFLTIVGATAIETGTLQLPVEAVFAAVVIQIALGVVPGLVLVGAVRTARANRMRRAQDTSALGGLLLVPGDGITALYRTFSDPCWDNPTCKTGTLFPEQLVTVGLLGMLLATAMSLLFVPAAIALFRRSGQS